MHDGISSSMIKPEENIQLFVYSLKVAVYSFLKSGEVQVLRPKNMCINISE